MTSSYCIPQWEECTSYGMRRVDPYTRLFEDQIILLGTPASNDITNTVMAQLLRLQSIGTGRQISIYINSPGGSLTTPTAIYDAMRYIKPDIQTVCLGQAASAAALLLAAGVKGKRLALPSSHILIHQPVTEGGYERSSGLEIQAKKIIRVHELMESMLIADTGQAVTKVGRNIERDKYLTAQEAVEYRVADDILTSLRNVGV